jgi:hypothetical protein
MKAIENPRATSRPRAPLGTAGEQFERAAVGGVGPAAKRRHFPRPTSASDCRPEKTPEFPATFHEAEVSQHWDCE